MSDNNSDYEKKLAQANAARLRQIDRKKTKLASPEYQTARLAKQKESQSRNYERLQERLSDPEYVEQQRSKQIRAAEKQRERLQARESDPVYIKQKIEKKIAQAKIIQDRAREKLLAAKKSTAVKTNLQNKSKSIGMKGRSPTAREKQLGNRIAEIGCICCLNKGWYTSAMQQHETAKFVSLHHVDGRTKDWAHAKVLPLCAYHHDTPAPADAPTELHPIHRGSKRDWEKVNGSEEELLKQVYEIIQESMPWQDSKTLG